MNLDLRQFCMQNLFRDWPLKYTETASKYIYGCVSPCVYACNIGRRIVPIKRAYTHRPVNM